MISFDQAGLPPGCVTGVGSLPFIDAEEAVEFVAEHCPELPFWPQLPVRCAGEGVIGQGLGRLIELLEPAERPYCWRVRSGVQSELEAGLERSDAGLVPETAAGFYALERALRAGRLPRARAVKAQIEGPATLAHCLFLNGEPMSRSSEWRDRLAHYLERQVVWQIQRLGALGLPVVFVLDEPVLTPALVGREGAGFATIASGVRRVLGAARRAGALVGIHCCAPLPLALLAEFDLDLVSFDANLPVDEIGFVRLARDIDRRKGCLAYGLAPTGSTVTTVESMEARWYALASILGLPSVLATQSLVTATCGLGLSTPAEAANSFALARRLAQSLRSYAAGAPAKSDAGETE
jgi:hypothetical protein